MNNCCNSGNTWNPPSAGGLIVVPPGSQAVQIPSVHPTCGGEHVSASGSVQEAAPGGGTSGLGLYPTVKNDFVAPALGSAGGFYSDFAAAWAVAGASGWIAPVGFVTITGISGALVSYVNVSIPQGTPIRAGAIILVAPPALSVGGGGNNSVPVDANALDSLGGILENQPRYLAGANGDILRNSGGRWLASAGRVYTSLGVPVDIAAGITPSVQPWAGTGDGILTATLNLPGLPTPLPPNFGAILTARIKQSAHSQDVEVSIAGQKLAAVRGANELVISSNTIRCTSATPQMVVTRAGTAQPIINVFVGGYFL